MTSSLSSLISEMRDIKKDKANYCLHIRKMNDRLKYLQTTIINILKETGQAGVTYKEDSIVIKKKPIFEPKKKKEKEKDSIAVLTKFGLNNAPQVLKELNQVKHGPVSETSTLEIKKIKKKI